MRNILDPNFQYIPSFETDLRRTFARVREEQRPPESRPNVIYLPDRMSYGARILQPIDNSSN